MKRAGGLAGIFKLDAFKLHALNEPTLLGALAE